MTDDPLDEIRRIRMQISAEHDHDIEKIGAYYMQKQRERAFEPCADPMGWGGFWEKWIVSCGESWRRPLTEQHRAMFPWPCQSECLWPGSAGPKLGLVCHAFWKWTHTCFQLEEPDWREECHTIEWRVPRPFWPVHECNQHIASRARLGPFIALEDGGGECIWPHPCMHGERPQ